MPLARHDTVACIGIAWFCVSTHMPLARHDGSVAKMLCISKVSTHMPLARHDEYENEKFRMFFGFYSHASCEA